MSRAFRISKKLDTLLEQEYHVLLGGDLAGIERLGSEKIALLKKIAGNPVDEIDDLSALRSRLIRNQVLAQSAIEGMRAAIQRAREINDVSLSLHTYRRDGQKSSVAIRMGDALSKRS